MITRSYMLIHFQSTNFCCNHNNITYFNKRHRDKKTYGKIKVTKIRINKSLNDLIKRSLFKFWLQREILQIISAEENKS